jgi:hypothetical protein
MTSAVAFLKSNDILDAQKKRAFAEESGVYFHAPVANCKLDSAGPATNWPWVPCELISRSARDPGGAGGGGGGVTKQRMAPRK